MPDLSRDKPLTYRELWKKLNKFGVQQFRKKGKGSHRGLYHPNINGRPVWYIVKCHGEGDELSRSVVRAVRQRFNIKIEDFY